MAAAVGDIILRIGTKLSGSGLKDLQAGIQMIRGLGQRVRSTVRELDAFKRVMGEVDMSMVNYADSAAAGQVQTLELMKALSNLNELGVKPTAEQFRILTIRAVDLAQKTGKDSTQQFIQMTNAIARAESEGLKPFGIKLKESSDLLAVQRDAVRRLTQGYEDMSVKAKTATEKLDRLANNISTTLSMIYARETEHGDKVGVFTLLDTVITELNADMVHFQRNITLMDEGLGKAAIRMDKVIQQLREGRTAVYNLQQEKLLREYYPEDYRALQAKRRGARQEYLRGQRGVAQRRGGPEESRLESWEYDLLEQQSRGFEKARWTFGEEEAGGGSAGGFLFDPGREMAANVRPEVAFWARTWGCHMTASKQSRLPTKSTTSLNTTVVRS